MKNLLKRFSSCPAGEKIAYLTAISVFLPYFITAIMALIFFCYAMFKASERRLAFKTPYVTGVIAFSAFAFIVALDAHNIYGALTALAFFGLLIIGRYIRSVMTREIFARLTDIICYTSLFATAVAIIEKLFHLNDSLYRCCGSFMSGYEYNYFSFYLNPNYLGAIMAVVIIVCAYKFLIRENQRLRYFVIALACLITILLTQSMFALIEMTVGVVALLFIRRRYGLVALVFGIIALVTVGIIIITEFMPNLAAVLFPRTDELSGTFYSRVRIWEFALEKIPDKLWLGRGFFAYNQVSAPVDWAYKSPHSHNIAIDFVLSFGILGALLAFSVVFYFIQRTILCKNFLKSGTATHLILAVIIGMLIHSFIDMTMLWLHTGLLYIIIFSGLGAEENKMTDVLKTIKPKEAEKDV